MTASNSLQDNLRPTINEQQIFSEPNEFSMYIETVASHNHQSCLEALVDYIDQRDIDIEKLADLINPSLKAKLFEDFVDLGMMKSQSTLTDFFA